MQQPLAPYGNALIAEVSVKDSLSERIVLSMSLQIPWREVRLRIVLEVSLRFEDDGENSRAVISVVDQGAGVPQAALADIFRPFYRVADARERQSGGIGLGLSISQQAVQVHGGTVTASNVPGRGLLVKIVLPLNKDRSF